jgi:hypothetical protein
VKTRLKTWLVKQKLLPEGKSLEDAEPLRLPPADPAKEPPAAKKAKITVTSFKEMWQPENVLASLTSSGVYEAGGSVLWATALPTTSAEEKCLNPYDGTFAQLLEARALFQQGQWKDGRIVYPTVLDVVVLDPARAAPSATSPYPRSLTLLSGHLVLYAWWYSLNEALQQQDDERLSRLWQAGLSATVRCNFVSSEAEVARMTIASSETLRTLSSLTSDNAVVFCERLSVLVKSYGIKQGDVVARLKADNVLFQGKPISKTLLVSAESVARHMTPESRLTLRYLESKYGRSLLTDNPSRLYKMILLISRASQKLPGESCQKQLSLVLCLMSLALDLEVLDKDSVTGEGLTGREGKDTKVSNAEDVPFVLLALTQLSVAWNARNSLSLLDDCPRVVQEVIGELLDPFAFRKMLDASFTSVRSSAPFLPGL